jgi:hypothetical protein
MIEERKAWVRQRLTEMNNDCQIKITTKKNINDEVIFTGQILLTVPVTGVSHCLQPA